MVEYGQVPDDDSEMLDRSGLLPPQWYAYRPLDGKLAGDGGSGLEDRARDAYGLVFPSSERACGQIGPADGTSKQWSELALSETAAFTNAAKKLRWFNMALGQEGNDATSHR